MAEISPKGVRIKITSESKTFLNMGIISIKNLRQNKYKTGNTKKRKNNFFIFVLNVIDFEIEKSAILLYTSEIIDISITN